MVDAAVSVAKIVLEKLIYCKKEFDDLASLCGDLKDQLEQLVHLCVQRQREPRFAGAVQRHFVQRLQNLAKDLDEIVKRREGGLSSRALLFFGSLWGGGAAADRKQLEDHVSAIDKLLTKLQVESGTVTASAAEELAGGAAAKFIKSEAMQQFWRSQFKNELKLPWEAFRETLAIMDDMRCSFPVALNPVLTAIRGKVDTSGDNMVHVSEFSEVFKPANPDVDGGRSTVADIIREHMVIGGRTLLPALTFGQVQPIHLVAVLGQFVVLGSRDGYVKLYLLPHDEDGVVACVGQFSLPTPPESLGIGYMKNGALRIFSANANRSVLVVDAWTGELTATIDLVGVAGVICSHEDVVFIGVKISHRVLVFHQNSNGGIVDSSAPNAESFRSGSTLVHRAIIHGISPLNSQHVLCCTMESGCTLWDYVRGQSLLHIPVNRLRFTRVMETSSSANGHQFVVIGAKDRMVMGLRLELRSEGSDTDSELRGVYATTTVDVGREVTTMGPHGALVLRDQEVTVHEYEMEKASASSLQTFGGCIRVLKKRVMCLPKALRDPRLCALDGFPGFIATGTILAMKNVPQWIIFSTSSPDSALKRVASGMRVKMLCSMPAAWNPLDSQLSSSVWSVQNQPLLPLPLRSSTGAPLLLSASTSKTVRVSEVDLKKATLHTSFEVSLEGGPERILSSHIVAMTANGHDVFLATGDGWILRYNFGTEAHVQKRCAASVEISQYLNRWAHKLSPATSTEALRRMNELSHDTVLQIRSALLKNGFQIRFDTSSEVFDAIQCEQFIQTLVDMKTVLLANAAAEVHGANTAETTSNAYTNAAIWAEPCAKVWLFDKEHHCMTCRRVLEERSFVAQLCMDCAANSEAYQNNRCVHCDAALPSSFKGNKVIMCDTCYDTRRASMKLNPMALSCVGDVLWVGACRDTSLYGPAGGTLVKLHAASLHVVDRLSASYAPFFNNICSSSGLCPFTCAPVSYATVGVFDCTSATSGIIASMVSSFRQSECLQAMVTAPAVVTVGTPGGHRQLIEAEPGRSPDGLEVTDVCDVFSSSVSVDLMWQRLVVVGTLAPDNNRKVQSIKSVRCQLMGHRTKHAYIISRLDISTTYVFAGDKGGGVAVFLRPAQQKLSSVVDDTDALVPILYLQSHSSLKVCSGALFPDVLLTACFDGTVGIVPMRILDAMADSIVVSNSFAATDRRSLIVLNRPLSKAMSTGDEGDPFCAERIDKQWKWRRTDPDLADNVFMDLNDVQKQEMIDVLQSTETLSPTVHVRRPNSVVTECLVNYRFRLDPRSASALGAPATQQPRGYRLEPSGMEVVPVHDLESVPLPLEADVFASLGSETIQSLAEGESLTASFPCPSREFAENSAARKWLAMHVFSKAPCRIAVHSPSKRFAEVILHLNDPSAPCGRLEGAVLSDQPVVWAALGHAPLDYEDGFVSIVIEARQGSVKLLRAPQLCEKRSQPHTPKLFVEIVDEAH